MGIYDRDYYRDDRGGLSLRLPVTVVGWIILLNVLVYLFDNLLTAEDHRVFDFLALRVSDLVHPWYWWRFLTYGFVHAPWPNFTHILFNMLGLFFLGREIEFHYGRKEFLWLYLALVVASGVIWAAANYLVGSPGVVVGASGAVVGVVVLYALNFPRRTLLLWGILPIPAWLLGVILVVMDLQGAAFGGGAGGPAVAYGVHLGGAAFAFLYHQFGWRLTSVGSQLSAWATRMKTRPVLRVHDPDHHEQEMNDEVDQILDKIHREGEASLTRRERRILENASREYQRRRRSEDTSDLGR